MIVVNTDGLLDVSPYRRGGIPLFLTGDYEVIEAPTIWTAQVSLRRSRSNQTLGHYANVLARYLNWLDTAGYGAANWQNVDREIIQSYITQLVEGRNSDGKPSDQTIEGYIARLADFYKWAKQNGYDHFWDMNQEMVRRKLKDQTLLNATVEVEKREFQLSSGTPICARKALDKFLDNTTFTILIKLLNDDVYKVIALTIRLTALRPHEVLQMPHLGTGINSGLRRYRDHELAGLDDITFTFKSKGKHRSINVPAELWAFICQYWMPERQRRAELYKKLVGVSPSNNVLFLSAEGRPVTYKMLYDHFGAVAQHPEFPRKRMTPYMLRHAFATYFVLEQLKAKKLLGQPYLYDAAADEALREFMGHNDIGTTYQYYVHLVSRFVQDDLIYDLLKQQGKAILSAFFEAAKLSEETDLYGQ
jgi:site-specific recombinase XerD